MGVVYIGDRGVGKTHLAVELANPNGNLVKVENLDYNDLKASLFVYDRPLPTEANQSVYHNQLNIKVNLPVPKQISVDWIDTAGEIWRERWQSDNQPEWRRFLDVVGSSEGILLILPPYREIIKPHLDRDEFITRQQWCNRFNRWVEFLGQNCTRVRHLAICLNKADIFCEYDQEARTLAYKPNGASMDWLDRHRYVYRRYFYPIVPQIEQIYDSIWGISIRCFITSVKNRSLLELPWIYLASFLDG